MITTGTGIGESSEPPYPASGPGRRTGIMSAMDLDTVHNETSPGLLARIRLRDRARAERDRWALWLPIGLGCGIGVYFRLTVEPPLWLGIAAVVALLGGVAIA